MLNHSHLAKEVPRKRPTGLEVAVLFHRFGPYHHARLRAAGACMKVTGIECSNVDQMYDWDLVNGADGFKRVQLFSEEAVENLPAERVLKRVAMVLDEVRPQAVAIPGWSDRCSLAALWWCASNRIPAVVMSETTPWDFQRHWLKEALKSRLLKLCASGLVGGRAHADYLTKLGFAPDNIFLGYDAVDNHYFSGHAAEIRSRAKEYRERVNLPQNYFLASARFVEKKNLSRLIQAYADYRKLSGQTGKSECAGEPWDLVLLGDGPLREAITQQIRALDLTRYVITPGFKQYDELPAYYALAKAFIHASTTEQWGLVVNEAMASGLPVLVSNRCGCSVDLIEEGVTGFSFDPQNESQMAGLMLRLTMNSTDLQKMGQAAEKRVAEWGVERFASGLEQAAASGMKALRQKPSVFDWLQLKLLLLHKGRVST